MFPFLYKKKLKFDVDALTNKEKDKIVEAFKIQFDNPKVKAYEILFDNFNVVLKRHSWLEGGTLTFNYSEKELTVKLELYFFMSSIIIFTFSLGILLLNYKRIWFGLVGMSVLVFFYSLLYFWTVSMFNLTIKHTIHKQLDLFKIERTPTVVVVSNVCPACGEFISNEVDICPFCGLYFK